MTIGAPLGVSLAVASKAPALPALKLVSAGTPRPPPPPVLRPVAKAPSVASAARTILQAPPPSVVDKSTLLKEPKPIVVQKSAASQAAKAPATPVQKLAPMTVTVSAPSSKASLFGDGPPASLKATNEAFAAPVEEAATEYDDADRGAVGVSVEAPDFVWKAAAAIGIAIGAWMYLQSRKKPAKGRR